MYLREIAIHADPLIAERYRGGFVQRFHRETCCITELYSLLISRKVVTKDVAKLQFVFTDRISAPADEVYPSNCIWPFDFSSYCPASGANKKERIIDALQEAVLWVAKKKGWASQPFVEAYDEAYRRNLVFEGLSRKSWRAPRGRYSVRIYYRFELEAVYLEAVLYKVRSRQELAKIPLGSALPEIDCLRQYIAQGAWISDTVFQLTSAGYWKDVWTADCSNIMPE